MKNIFLDCGTHLCEGLLDFYNKKIIDETFEIHTFEANPACLVEERVKKIPLNIIVYNKAVWVEDGYVNFNQENHKKSGTGSPSDGLSDLDGWGSSIDGIGFNHNGYDTSVMVESIDFSNFVNKLPKNSHIICKMDIEGSEFQVLRKMIKDGTITKIHKIYIEFHERFMPNESVNSKNVIIEDIKKMGVDVETWF
jgi:FkbM family methyltransferase